MREAVLFASTVVLFACSRAPNEVRVEPVTCDCACAPPTVPAAPASASAAPSKVTCALWVKNMPTDAFVTLGKSTMPLPIVDRKITLEGELHSSQLLIVRRPDRELYVQKVFIDEERCAPDTLDLKLRPW